MKTSKQLLQKEALEFYMGSVKSQADQIRSLFSCYLLLYLYEMSIHHGKLASVVIYCKRRRQWLLACTGRRRDEENAAAASPGGVGPVVVAPGPGAARRPVAGPERVVHGPGPVDGPRLRLRSAVMMIIIPELRQLVEVLVGVRVHRLRLHLRRRAAGVAVAGALL